MTVCVFVGPTLPQSEVKAILDAVCLPPVAQGDVYRVATSQPRAIGIIDGYFDGMPAVWHKEVLWALSQGIHVFGSASMGALRAAELHAFGMRGVGRIFEAYLAGELEDDDEVAVVHGPAAIGYPSLSDAMVNIRATLADAERAGVISAIAQAAMIESAKRLFYQDRTWERLLTDAAAAGMRDDEFRRLRDWLPAGRIDRKRTDALEMIAEMRDFLAGDPGPMQAAFRLEWTDMWEIAMQSTTTARAVIDGVMEERSADEWLFDELRLDEDAFDAVRQRALLRRAAASGRRWEAPAVDASTRRAAERRLRLRLGLPRRAQLDQWCSDNDLTPADFARLIDEEACCEALAARLDPDLRRAMLDQLRLDGDYGRLAARARDKRAILAARGVAVAAPADIGMTPIALVAWYFEKRLARSVPDDLEAHAKRHGLTGIADFYRLLAHEWLYSQRG